MRLDEVMRLTGFRKSWIYFLMERDQFPASRKIGSRAVGWNSAEIEQWIQDRIG